MNLFTLTPALSWLELTFGRSLDAAGVHQLIGSLLASNHLKRIVFETHYEAGNLSYRIGSNDAPEVIALAAQVPVDLAMRNVERKSPRARTAFRVEARPWDRMLATAQPVAATARLLGALAMAATAHASGQSEEVIHQLVITRRLPPRVPARQVHELSGDSILEQAISAVTSGPVPLTTEQLKARSNKQSVIGAEVAWRILSSNSRNSSAIRTYRAALRSLETPGLRLRLVRERTQRGVDARPVRLLTKPIILNLDELATISAWPFGALSYPNLDRSGARRLPTATPCRQSRRRTVALSDHPATSGQPLVIPESDALTHTHILGPTGVGKSNLLHHLILSDIKAGRGVVVLDPKGDLVEDVLATAPESEINRLVVLDPARTDYLVGFNPLQTTGPQQQLAVDGLLHVFAQLYGSNFGPRSADIVAAALSTLAASQHPTLCLMPQLLIDKRLRQVVHKQAKASSNTNAALEMFWVWYEGLGEAERNRVIAAVNNKIRPLVMRNSLRGVLGQIKPKFDLSEVFSKRKVLLVPLRKGQVGPQTAQLLGSMIVSNLWLNALNRTSVERSRRSPVFLYVDEFQDYLHLPTDMGDVLAQARGLGLAITLAHQHLGQLNASMRSAVLANTRNKITFNLSASDARTVAAQTPELESIDFQELDRYQIYMHRVQHGQSWTSGRTLAPPPALRRAETLAKVLAERYGRKPVDIDVDMLRPITDRVDQPRTPVGRRPRRPSGGQ